MDDKLKGATGASENAGTASPYFGTRARGHTTDHRPDPRIPAESMHRLRPVRKASPKMFADVAGPSAGSDTVFHGRPVGGSSASGPRAFDIVKGGHGLRKVGGNSGSVHAPHRAYVGPGGMNGSSRG